MVRLLKSLNKEQLTTLVTVILCAAMLILGLAASEAAPPFEVPNTGARGYRPPKAQFPNLSGPSFDPYWKGRDIFKGETATHMKLPPSDLPEPRVEGPAAPPFAPCPRFSELNTARMTHRYLYPDMNAPPLDPAALPPSTEISSLAGIAEKEMPAPADHRDSQEYEYDGVLTQGGQKYEGEIILEKDGKIVLKVKEGTGTRTFEAAKVKIIQRNWTYRERYEKRLEALDKSDPEARYGLAEWCLRTEVMKDGVPTGDRLNMRAEAKEQLREAIKLRKDYWKAIDLLGRIHQEDMEFDAAIHVYREALEHVGAEKDQLLLGLGICFEKVGILEGARENFRESFRVNPRFTEGRIAAARAELRAENFEEVIRVIDAAVDRFGAADADAFAYRGRAKLRLGRLEEAREDLNRALAAQANHAVAMNDMGVVDVLEGKISDAAAKFMGAIQVDQYTIDSWNNLGLLHLLAGKTAEADILFRAAAQRDPASLTAMTGQGLTKWIQDDLVGAEADVRKALEAAPEDYYVNYLMGHLAYRAEEYQQALQNLETCLRKEFLFVPAHYPSGLTYLQEAGRLDAAAFAEQDENAKQALQEQAELARLRAEALFQTARDFLEGRSDPLIALGCVRLAMGRWEEANEFFLEARRIREEDPVLMYALGYITYNHGEGEDRERVEAALAESFRRGAALEGKFFDAASGKAVARCKSLVGELTEWLLTRVVVDDRFDRPDSKDVGNKWIEQDKAHGIAVTLEKGRAKFSGKQVNKDMGVTALERNVSKEGFYLVEATFYPENLRDAEVGISVYWSSPSPQMRLGFHLGRDMEGNLRTKIGNEKELQGQTMQAGWDKPNVTLPNPDEIRIRLRRSARRDAKFFDAELWNPDEGTWIVFKKDIAIAEDRNPTWKISIWGRGYRGQEYSFFVDNVRVYERKSR